MSHLMYKRLSIATGAGKVMTITQSAKNLSDALEQEMSYYQRSNRIPAEIDINKEE